MSEMLLEFMQFLRISYFSEISGPEPVNQAMHRRGGEAESECGSARGSAHADERVCVDLRW